MFRAFSTRRGHSRYEKLGNEPAARPLEGAKLKRTKSLPDRALGSSSDPAPEVASPAVAQEKPPKKVNKSHPLFGLFDARRKKKTTARPELARS
ncbi:hypothetical protein BT93_L5786 [Corymbia citriodora subsp. variegata]|uniref:Uncharacterized protein n=1 Tax=Corymbia citriodora subsp. variegata TaxID=360336 RepID=A0A8T0CVY0_CORYI|nr:hypothetical protein BT93_L5786 [Corymbia citriodora subsp. variegata]